MKKLLCLILAVLFLTSLIACTSEERTNTTTTEPKYRAYTLYQGYTVVWEGVGGLEDYFPQYESCPLIQPIAPYQSEKYQALAWSQPFLFEFNGESRVVTPTSQIERNARWLNQYCLVEHQSNMTVDPVRNEIISMEWNMPYDDTEQALELTLDECRARVHDFFVSQFHQDLSIYRETVVAVPVYIEGIIIYRFTYVKYIDDIQTDDEVSVSIRSTGEITSFTRGPEINLMRYRAMRINYDRIETIVNEYLVQFDANNIHYKMSDWKIMQWYGYYVMECDLMLVDDRGYDLGVIVPLKIPLENIYE